MEKKWHVQQLLTRDRVKKMSQKRNLATAPVQIWIASTRPQAATAAQTARIAVSPETAASPIEKSASCVILAGIDDRGDIS
jgi:hypothetical protein